MGGWVATEQGIEELGGAPVNEQERIILSSINYARREFGKEPMQKLERETVLALCREAGAAGDWELVDVCNEWLGEGE